MRTVALPIPSSFTKRSSVSTASYSNTILGIPRYASLRSSSTTAMSAALSMISCTLSLDLHSSSRSSSSQFGAMNDVVTRYSLPSAILSVSWSGSTISVYWYGFVKTLHQFQISSDPSYACLSARLESNRSSSSSAM